MGVDTRVVLEPAGALATAGLKKYAAHTQSVDKTFVAVTSGANMDFDRLRFISERADYSETLISVVIPEEPGSFIKFYNIIAPRNITEFSYRISGAVAQSPAFIIMSFQATSEDDKLEALCGLAEAGFSPEDLSNDELAKTHGRHLVGGRAASELTKNESIYRFE